MAYAVYFLSLTALPLFLGAQEWSRRGGGDEPGAPHAPGSVFEVITNYGYTVFPLFILKGQIGFNAGIAVRLYDSAHKFIGHIPGGLAMATVMGATAFKAICGSSAATSATFASVAIPEMDRYGYDKKLSTGYRCHRRDPGLCI